MAMAVKLCEMCQGASGRNRCERRSGEGALTWEFSP